MQTWILYAILSMMFAGVTAVLAKYGLQNISADFGLGIRTAIIFVIITELVDSVTLEAEAIPEAECSVLLSNLSREISKAGMSLDRYRSQRLETIRSVRG